MGRRRVGRGKVYGGRDMRAWVGTRVRIGVTLGLGLCGIAAGPGVVLAADSAVVGAHGVTMYGPPKYPATFTHFDYVNPDAPKGGEIRLSAFGSYDSLNPFILKGQPAAGAAQVFETLTESSSDEPFAEYGLLAESIDIPADRAWVAFTLRPEARFHDGTPVTVDDVIWSFETLRRDGHPFYRTYYASVTKAEAVGPRQVRFTFAGPGNRELPLIMGQLPVLPKHAFANRAFASTTLEPIPGSGPYRVTAVDPGRSVTYQRVEDWWGAKLPLNRGRYNFSTIRYDYYRDLGVAFEAFKAGAYDLRIESSSKNWVTGYDIPAVKDGRLVREELPHHDPQGLQAFVFNTRRPLFQDRRVRQALNTLFDYEWTRANISFGLFQRSSSFFSNSEFAATGLPGADELKLLEPFRGRVPDEVFSQPFQLSRTDGTGNIRPQLRQALTLLREAGWELKDQKLVKTGGGEPFSFEILLVQPDMERVVQPFVRNLEKAGIAATIRVADSAQYQNRVDSFDFDMIITHWGQSLSPGNEQRDFWGSAAAKEPGSRNTFGITDPAVDSLIQSLIMAQDRAGLVAATRALDRVLLWGWYVIPHWHDTVHRVAYWNRFGHPAVPARYGQPYVATWWVDPARDAGLKR